jgi:hypothetical protein
MMATAVNMRTGKKWLWGMLVAAALASATATARPKSTAGCPKSPPQDGAACSRKQASCSYRCEGEGHRDRQCTCAKDEAGSWRWQCEDFGSVCTL